MIMYINIKFHKTCSSNLPFGKNGEHLWNTCWRVTLICHFFLSTYVCASVKSVGKKIFNFRHTDFTIYYCGVADSTVVVIYMCIITFFHFSNIKSFQKKKFFFKREK